jgi:CubicO group peptidase (beta-lactamase class C family)
MKTIFFFIAGLATLCLNAQGEVHNKLDTLLNRLEENNNMMGGLVISTPEGIDYQRALGFANVEQEVPNTLQTRFRIGSISKTFTALIIMQLLEEGKLTLNQTLSDFFPELPNAQTITLKQMLGHRSGLYNFTNAEQYSTYMEEVKSRQEMLTLIKEGGTVFKPGEKMEYSNTNYVLLSFIAEDLEQQSFAEIFKKRIAQPLKLENTFIEESGQTAQKAESYYWNGTWQVATHTDPSIPMGAGAVLSTPQELNRAFKAIFSHALCSTENLKLMKEEHLGLFQYPLGEIIAYGHNGGIDGYMSNAAYFPTEGVTVVFLGNGMNYSLNQMMLGVLSIYFEQPYRLPTFGESITVAPAILEQYVGLYKSASFPRDINLSVENGQLKAQATGQPAFTLEAKSKVLFTFPPAGLEIEFGQRGQFTLRQGGQVIEFVREG